MKMGKDSFDYLFRYTYSEKAVTFLRNLFERMNAALTSHEVTIILFARLYYPGFKNLKRIQKEFYKRNSSISPHVLEVLSSCFHLNKDRDVFQDVYFKVGVFEPSRNNWDNILKKLKRIFNYFPSLINWKINNDTVRSLSKAYPAKDFTNGCPFLNDSDVLQEQFIRPTNMVECELSYCANTNFLEAVNLAVKHLHIDQSTKHVGAQILVLSAGTGVYRVCPDIAIPTRRRILQTGVMTRIVSLNKPPSNTSSSSHSAVFIYK